MPRSKLRTEQENRDEHLQAALDEVWRMHHASSGDFNVTKIANSFNVSKATLSRLYKKSATSVPKKGRPKSLPDEYEEEIARSLKVSASQCKAWSFGHVRTAAQLSYNLFCEENAPTMEPPAFSDSWISDFCGRHGITLKSPVKLSKARMEATDRMELMSFIALIEDFAQKKSLTASCVFTCDETGSIPRNGTSSKFLCAKGQDLFDFSPTIKVPKFSLLCCINAEGDHLPPLIAFPQANAKKRVSTSPTVLPKEQIPGWELKWTKTGTMTTEIFSNWLLESFAPQARQKNDPDAWILLIMDNCASHFSESAFKSLHEKKIAVAFFVPNSTHLASPLDISIYGPLKAKLKSSLARRNSLSKSNLADWIGPAFYSVFTKKNILAGFLSSGIWNPQKNGPDFMHVSSQYRSLLQLEDSSFKKKNTSAKRSELLLHQSKRLASLFDEELSKIGDPSKTVAGKRFFSKSLAGSIVSPETLEKVSSQRNLLVNLHREEIQTTKDAKKMDSSASQKKIQALLEEKKQNLRAIKLKDKEIAKEALKHKRETEKAQETIQRQAEELELWKESFDLVLEKSLSGEVTAEGLNKEFIQRSVDTLLLKRSAPFQKVMRRKKIPRRI
jgi:DDE superfamily endonuclease